MPITKRSEPEKGQPRARLIARLVRTPDGWALQPPESEEGLRVWRDEEGRACVTLHVRHPYANSAGWQRLYRFLVMEALGEVLDPMSHVHHANGKKVDDSVDNLEVLAASYHGRTHASGYISHARDPATGRFCVVEDPGEFGGEKWVPRWGAIIGPSAMDRLKLFGGPPDSWQPDPNVNAWRRR